MDVGLTGRRRIMVAVGAAALGLLFLVSSAAQASLRPELHFTERSYRPGESVPFSLEVCSTSLLPMRTPDGKPTWRITNAAGDVVADSSHQVFTLELKTLWWSPRQCRRVLSVAWEQREWNQQALGPDDSVGVPRRGAAVPSGEYALELTWGNLGARRTTFEISK